MQSIELPRHLSAQVTSINPHQCPTLSQTGVLLAVSILIAGVWTSGLPSPLEFVSRLLADVTAVARPKEALQSLDAFVFTQGNHQDWGKLCWARHLHWDALFSYCPLRECVCLSAYPHCIHEVQTLATPEI